MLDGAERVSLGQISIRGRVALVLACAEGALVRYQVRDARISELLDALWAFVEHHWLNEADEVWRGVPAAHLFDYIERGEPLPEAYHAVPRFLVEVLLDALVIGQEELYTAIQGCSEETLRLTAQALNRCRQHGVPIPAPEQFAQIMPYAEEGGWGREVSRSTFLTAASHQPDKPPETSGPRPSPIAGEGEERDR